MGNNNSSASHSGQNADSPRSVRRDTVKHPNSRRVAAPPEYSHAQAQGTIPHPNPKNQPLVPANLLNNGTGAGVANGGSSDAPASGATPVNAGENQPSRPVDVKAPPQTKNQFPHESYPSKPVAVPNSQTSANSPRSPFSDTLDASTVLQGSVQDMSYLTRPPRMPLPIEEEVHTPGSPIIPPTDIGEPVDEVDSLDSEGLPRRASTLSSSTIDEDDSEELRVDKTRPTVPTRLEWLRGGEKVYVTGTIFHWNRKTRLHPVEGRPGVFAATINIQPGTHHIRFLVDGQMQTSPDLPTTVDFGNNLVNYIEVNPDDALSTHVEDSGAHVNAAKKNESTQSSQEEEEDVKTPSYRETLPPSAFSHKIPDYLADFDLPDESPLYQAAWSAIGILPTPPTLPGFLAKPILNAATLIKDDNSVLNMPNHTVLNHLMTSSIKNNILAVSGTTRYKNKYVTTIIYKPTDKPADPS